MTYAVVFGVFLVVAVLLSERARTTVLSSSVMFLVAGIIIGSSWLPWHESAPTHEVLAPVAKLALFVVLFVDGAQLDGRDIARAWRLPGRALLLGLPLTVGLIAIAAHFLLGVGWLVALLVGAVLSPTDPVMVRTILAHEAVPERLRRLLSVESGLNDGLALPPIIVLLAMLGVASAHPLFALLEAVGGLAIGVGIAMLSRLEGVRGLASSETYRPLMGIAIGTLIFGVCELTHANELLAAFAAGVTLATVRGDLARTFVQTGEPMSEAIKLAVLLLFGASLTFDFELSHIVLAGLTVIAARPIALLLAFIGGGLTRKEWLVAAWFGPKGFASLLYAALVVSAGVPDAEALYHVVGFVVAVSIVAHSSTDALVARTFTSAEHAEAR